jgi:hypothetical protein
MKKLLLTTALGLLAASGFAQGTITFANDAATLVTTNDLAAGGAHTGAATSANGTRVVLYYSTAAVAPAINTGNLTDLTGWTLSSPSTPDIAGTPLAGRFSGGTQTTDSSGGGATVWVMVRGWTGGFADWATAYAAANQPGSSIFIGTTKVAFQTPTGAPFGTPPTAAVPMTLGPSGFNGLVLTPVPEPSTFVLAGLGAAALMIFRRRK